MSAIPFIIGFLIIVACYIAKSRKHCPHCDGTGELPQNGYETDKQFLECPVCKGKGILE